MRSRPQLRSAASPRTRTPPVLCRRWAILRICAFPSRHACCIGKGVGARRREECCLAGCLFRSIRCRDHRDGSLVGQVALGPSGPRELRRKPHVKRLQRHPEACAAPTQEVVKLPRCRWPRERLATERWSTAAWMILAECVQERSSAVPSDRGAGRDRKTTVCAEALFY